MEKLSKELIGASSTPIILSILKKNESYGYEIIQNTTTSAKTEKKSLKQKKKIGIQLIK